MEDTPTPPKFERSAAYIGEAMNPTKAAENEMVTSFVKQYAAEKLLPQSIGITQTEKKCLALAKTAREEFKFYQRKVLGYPSSAKFDRDANSFSATRTAMQISVIVDHPMKRKMSAAEKYNIRLQNNRKSAQATKVFHEVYGRELCKGIHDLESTVKKQRIQLEETFRRIDDLTEQIRRGNAQGSPVTLSPAPGLLQGGPFPNQISIGRKMNFGDMPNSRDQNYPNRQESIASTCVQENYGISSLRLAGPTQNGTAEESELPSPSDRRSYRAEELNAIPYSPSKRPCDCDECNQR